MKPAEEALIVAVGQVTAAAASENGATANVTVETLQGRVEIRVTPEMGLQLARKIRHAAAKAWVRQIDLGAREKLDAGPEDVVRAQAALVEVDPGKPDRAEIHGLGVPFPPVMVIPVDRLPALIASAQQALEDLGLQQFEDPAEAAARARQGARHGQAGAVVDPDNPERVGILMPAPDGSSDEQAMVIRVDAIDGLVEMLLEAKAEAIRRRGGRPRLN